MLNSYDNFTQVLTNLGIETGKEYAHNNHFHVYLSPPDPQKIIDSAKLLAPEVSTQQELGALTTQEPTTYSALTGAEEIIMRGFIVPTLLPAPAVLIAEAPAKNITPATQVNRTVTSCYDTESAIPDSAANHFSPIKVDFLRQIGAKHGFTVPELKPYRVTLLTPPQHGEVRLVYEPSHHWAYVPSKGYTGTDRAIYLVEKQGKRCTVVVNLWVVEVLSDDSEPPLCKSVKFAPFTGPEVPAGVPPTSINDFKSWASDALLASILNTTNLNFSDLAAGEVGNTTGTGPTAKITLDTNAAGHGWYIDPTPLSNEEFLPTADANIWQAKPGSAAAGKMDMLSVLLHEYGHRLGLEHSTAASDAMAATLKPGERRLFTADELAQVERFNMTFAALDASPQIPSQPGSPQVHSTSLLLGLSLIRRRSAMDTGADNLTAANASLTNGAG